MTTASNMDNPFDIVLFHALYKSTNVERPLHPYLYISDNDFERCIRQFLENGYTFIDPENMGAARSNGREVLLTFDDGYYNNIYALDVLEKFDIKALFFVVNEQIVEQKLFWWDVYFKNLIHETPFATIYSEIQKLKLLKASVIEKELKSKFGEDCFLASEDFDRPLTEEELLSFSKHPQVSIGGHSARHNILTNLDSEEIREEVVQNKRFIEGLIGKGVRYFSYPNGNFDDETVAIVKEAGYECAVTTIPEGNPKSYVHDDQHRWVLNRYSFPVPGSEVNVVEQVSEFINRQHA